MTGPPQDEEEDAAVIAASVGEPELFAVIFDRHVGEIHRYVAWRLGGELAEDVVAETFLIAFRKREKYDAGRRDARPWLYGIASNAMRDHRRAEVRRHRVMARAMAGEQVAAFDERSVERVAAEVLQPRLRGVLARLSAKERDLLLLIAWAELSYEEAADALGVPIGTVRSRLHRIRVKVRRGLGGVDPTGTFEEALA